MTSDALSRYLEEFESDRQARNRVRDWSFQRLNLRLVPDVFPSDSPYSLTTVSMLETLDKDQGALLRTTGPVVDVGTGNGAFAVFLGMSLPSALVIAVDKDVRALAATNRNARESGASNIEVAGSDLFSGLSLCPRLGLVVAAIPFAQELEGSGLLERFWSEARQRMATGSRVYFSWVEWVGFARVESAAIREGFSLLRWDEYQTESVAYRWRVYVFEPASS